MGKYCGASNCCQSTYENEEVVLAKGNLRQESFSNWEGDTHAQVNGAHFKKRSIRVSNKNSRTSKESLNFGPVNDSNQKILSAALNQ